jgi:hypothetical protein
VFYVSVISGHCLQAYPMVIINDKMSHRLSRLSYHFRKAIRKDNTCTLFCRGKRKIFVLYFPKVYGERDRQVERIQRADYY